MDSDRDERSELKRFDFNQYPRRRRILSAKVKARLVASHSEIIVAPAQTTLTMKLATDIPRQLINKNEIIGHFALQELAMTKRQLELQKQISKVREDLLRHVELPRETLELNRMIEQIDSELAAIDIATNDAAIQVLKELISDIDATKLYEKIKVLKQQKAWLTHQMNILNDKHQNPQLLQLKEDQIALEHKIELYKKREKQSILQMPFDGWLELSPYFRRTKGTAFKVTDGQTLGLAYANAFRLVMPVSRLQGKFSDQSALILEAALPDGQRIQATTYERQMVMNERGEASSELSFHIEHTVSPAAFIGASIDAVIFQKLNQDATIIPKMDLCLAHAQTVGRFASHDWHRIVLAIWPEKHLIYAGLNELAIVERTNGPKGDKITRH